MIGKIKALNLLLREVMPGGHDSLLDEFALHGPRGGFLRFGHHAYTRRISMAWIGRAIQAGGVRHGHAFFRERVNIKGPGVTCWGWGPHACKASCIIERNDQAERVIKAVQNKEKFKHIRKLLEKGETQAALMLLRLL